MMKNMNSRVLNLNLLYVAGKLRVVPEELMYNEENDMTKIIERYYRRNVD